MIYARPGQSFYAFLEDAPTGLVGTLAVGIETPTGTVVTAEATAGVTEPEAGTGDYTAALTAPTETGTYLVVWHNPDPDPDVYTREELVVSGLIPADVLNAAPTDGVPFGDLVARLQEMTEVTPIEAKARINQAHRRWVAECEALKQKVTIGPTVAGTSVYELDAAIVNMPKLRVDGKRYYRVNIDDLEDLQGGEWGFQARQYPARFFAPDWSTGGAPSVSIFPEPTQAGLLITARVSLLPADMSADDDYPRLPADFHEDLVDDAMATVLRRDDERLGDAAALDERARLRKKELRGRLMRRVGSGPVFIRAGR